MSAEPMHCVAAGWVEHSLDVPLGHHLGFELWKSGGIAVPKPENGAFSKKRPKEIELRLTPPIALIRQFDGDIDAIVSELTALREAECARLAKARFGPVRGVKEMRGVHPWDEPDTGEERGGLPFSVRHTRVTSSAIDAHSRRTRIERRTRSGSCGGKREIGRARFPAGTLRGRTFLGMPLDEPADDAILGTPHPSREEVEAEIAEKRARRAKSEEARRERMRTRQERRERAREWVEAEAHARELEDEARRVRLIGFDLLKKPDLKPSAESEPKSIVRRGLDDAHASKTEGQRVVVLRTRDAKAGAKSTRRRRGRGATCLTAERPKWRCAARNQPEPRIGASVGGGDSEHTRRIQYGRTWPLAIPSHCVAHAARAATTAR